MGNRLLSTAESRPNQMGIEVSTEQKDLKEQHAGRPYCRAAPVPRQNVASQKRLDEEQQEGPKKHGNGVAFHIGGYSTTERVFLS
jgi:hypothetical protein